MGVLPRLYQSNGSLCAEPSDYIYTSTDADGFSDGVYGNCGTALAYHSYGVTKSWNGNGYNAYFTYVSPNVNS
jgi:hypothetical protein